jgi:hypothetical protein
LLYLEPYITGLFTDLDRRTATPSPAALAVVDLPASGGDAHGHEPRSQPRDGFAQTDSA